MTLDEARLCSHVGEAALWLAGMPAVVFAQGTFYMTAPYRKNGVHPLVRMTDEFLIADLRASADWQPFGAPVSQERA